MALIQYQQKKDIGGGKGTNPLRFCNKLTFNHNILFIFMLKLYFYLMYLFTYFF